VAGTNQLNLSSTATTITQPTTTPMITLTNVNSSPFYQEGTWTVVAGDGTHNLTPYLTTNTAYYTQIGNMIFININYSWTSKGSATGTLEVTLPFTASAAKFTGAAFNVGACTGFPSTFNFVGAQGNQNKNYAYFFGYSNFGTVSAVACSALASSGSIILSGTYSI